MVKMKFVRVKKKEIQFAERCLFPRPLFAFKKTEKSERDAFSEFSVRRDVEHELKHAFLSFEFLPAATSRFVLFAKAISNDVNLIY
jgi:hypothetical protein